MVHIGSASTGVHKPARRPGDDLQDVGHRLGIRPHWLQRDVVVVDIKINIITIQSCVLGNDAFVGIFPIKAPEIGLLQRLSPTNTDQGVKPEGNWIVNLPLVERLGC